MSWVPSGPSPSRLCRLRSIKPHATLGARGCCTLHRPSPASRSSHWAGARPDAPRRASPGASVEVPVSPWRVATVAGHVPAMIPEAGLQPVARSGDGVRVVAGSTVALRLFDVAYEI